MQFSLLLLALPIGCASDDGGREYDFSHGTAADDDSGDTDMDDGSDPPDPSGNDDDTQPPQDEDHSDAVDEYILGLGHLSLVTAEPEHEIDCEPVQMDCPPPWQEDELTCELQYFTQTQHFDTYIALQPDSPALWPGAIVRGPDQEQGFLAPIGLPRAPATFSISLENLVASPAATLESPSLSTFREARNQILAGGLQGATPANVSYEIHSVESRSQLSLFVGAAVNWTGVVDFDGMFDFEEGDFANNYLFDFTQTYYTIDLDTPGRPSDMFLDEVSVADLQSYTGPGAPPVYVQSVSYGRRVLFAMESNASLESIVAAIDVAVSGVADLEAQLEADSVLGASKITASVVGGDGDGAVATILGVEELMAFITEGGNYSADSPGAPIAYKTAYLDNVPMRMALTATYPQTRCQ
jgi:thiol-activated cytolysin